MICQRQESGRFKIELSLLKAHLEVSGPEQGICSVARLLTEGTSKILCASGTRPGLCPVSQ